ncbi:unnamed protein product, partial [Caretta caretta]
DGSEQAQSNLRFLSILKEPFQELSTLRPRDIPNKLPHLISLVRIIWVNSLLGTLGLSGKGWVLDQTSIFAQVDAFVQRCKDLLEAIKRTFDKKAVDVYMLFNRELALVNKELSKKLPFLPAHMCHYAGLAHWLRALHRRIDRPLKGIIAMLSPEERALFKEWIRYLDRKIQPGLKKLHWSLKGASATFINEC